MKTVGTSKPAAAAPKPVRPNPSARDVLPLKMESRQSIKLLPVTPVHAKAALHRKASKSVLELPANDTPRVGRVPGTPKQPPSLTTSAVQDERRAATSRPLASERGKVPTRPLPPTKPTLPKTPSKISCLADPQLRRKGSNSNLGIPQALPALPIMDLYVTEVFEEPPKSSLASADSTLDRLNLPKETLQATVSTCAAGRSSGHAKSDSANLDTSKPNSITPFVTRSFLEITLKTDKDPRTPLNDTASLLEDRSKLPLLVPELLGTFSRMSSAVKGSVERRRTVARESRKVALLRLRDQVESLEDKCAFRGLTALRRFVSHAQRLRKRQAVKAILSAAKH